MVPSIEIVPQFGYVVLLIPVSWILLNWLALETANSKHLYAFTHPPKFGCRDCHHNGCLSIHPPLVMEVITSK